MSFCLVEGRPPGSMPGAHLNTHQVFIRRLNVCRNARFLCKVGEWPRVFFEAAVESLCTGAWERSRKSCQEVDGAPPSGRNVGEAYPRLNTTPADGSTVPRDLQLSNRLLIQMIQRKNLLCLLGCVLLQNKTNICSVIHVIQHQLHKIKLRAKVQIIHIPNKHVMCLISI